MAEWWQSPAYLQRQAAGQVQTPGLIDIGGLTQRLYDDFQAPYWRRQDEIQGAAVADPMQSRYVAQPRFIAQMNQQQDPLQQYAESGYVAKPRFIAATAKSNTVPAMPNQPAGSIRVAKDQSRLASGPAGWDPTYGYMPAPSAKPALAAIEAAAPTGPMFPLKLPGKGTPFTGNYTASMRFASPNAGQGSDIIDLTATNPRNPQAMADSQGKPVRVGNSVYYPGGRVPQGAAPAPRGATTQQRSGGLLGSLFGGGNGGGIFSGGLGSGSSSIGTSPSQGQAMTVDPNTSTGSTLSSMGFSSGALVPAATIRNLESRGYFN